jgi:hypothetical protein
VARKLTESGLSDQDKRVILAYEHECHRLGNTPTPEGRRGWMEGVLAAEREANHENDTFWEHEFGKQPPAEPDLDEGIER